MKYPRQKKFLGYLTDLNRSRNTILGYDSDLTAYFNEFKKVTQDNVQEFIYLKSREGRNPASIRRSVSAIKTYCRMFNLSLNFNLINTPRISVREASFITEAIFAGGIHNLINDRGLTKPVKYVRFSFYVLFNTGLRIEEFLSLTKENYDAQTNSLLVIGKGDKQRRIPLGNLDLSIFEEDKFYTFLHNTSYSAFLLWTKKYFGDEYSPHSFRHGYTTKLVKNGASQYTVKSVLGHASYSTTLRYFHLGFDEVSDEINQALS